MCSKLFTLTDCVLYKNHYKNAFLYTKQSVRKNHVLIQPRLWSALFFCRESKRFRVGGGDIVLYCLENVFVSSRFVSVPGFCLPYPHTFTRDLSLDPTVSVYLASVYLTPTPPPEIYPLTPLCQCSWLLFTLFPHLHQRSISGPHCVSVPGFCLLTLPPHLHQRSTPGLHWTDPGSVPPPPILSML